MPASLLVIWSTFPGARRHSHSTSHGKRAGTWFGESPAPQQHQKQPVTAEHYRFIGVETMSITPVAPSAGSAFVRTPAVRRVRHQARDVLALMAFSAGTSIAIALLMLVLAAAGR